ncbi:MAG: TIM barrel protein [Chloroflexi bacterium]|nr:TIM barrel protein [Chloroflexota bacterium]
MAEAGFEAIEIGFYGQLDLDELKTAKEKLGLQLVLLNMDVPGWGPGNRGYMADPSGREIFSVALAKALRTAEALHAKKMMLPIGASIPGISPEVQTACIVENLVHAARQAEQTDILLTIEPLSPAFASDYFLTSSAQALDIVHSVNHPLVKFQFDTFHLQITEGNLIHTLRENMDAIGHIQFADAPGRTEPGQGELNFQNIARAADEAGYRSYIGLEYVPVSRGAATFDWVPTGWRRYRGEPIRDS